MNPRLLQLGAEVLGWEWTRYDGEAWRVVDDQQGVWCWVDKRAHALPAYMAEALVERILQEKDSPVVLAFHAFAIVRGEGAAITGPSTIIGCWLRAPVDARIAAALVALGRITLDEAREEW